MPDSKQAPLRKLLKRSDISSLLSEFEALLPGYGLSLLDEGGNLVAGNFAYTPVIWQSLLKKAIDAHMVEL